MASDQPNTPAITPTEADLARDLRADLVALVEGREIPGGQEEYQMARAGIVRAIAAEARVKELEAELQRLREDAEDQRLEWQFRDTCGE